MFYSKGIKDTSVSDIAKMVAQNVSFMNLNLILKEWYNKEPFSRLEQQFYEQGGIESFDEVMRSGEAESIRNRDSTFSTDFALYNGIYNEGLNCLPKIKNQFGQLFLPVYE